MRNKTVIACATLLGLLAASCVKDNLPSTVQTPITINASYAPSGAKVTYTENGNIISATWQEGDELKVVYNNTVNTLTLTDGAGTQSASFSGSIEGTPSATAVLICYVSDANNPGAVTVSGDGSYTYTSDAFLGQDGTLAGAAKCNLYYGLTQYGDGTNIGCTFNVNTSMMKFTVTAPEGVRDGVAATLTYKSGDTEVSKASFTVGDDGNNTIYLSIPAGNYSGAQTLVYKSGDNTETRTLSATAAHFTAGQTYSKTFHFAPIDLSTLTEDYTAANEEVLKGTLGSNVTISIADGATVTLDGVSINADGYLTESHAGIVCLGDATIILKSGTVNTVKGFAGNYPGIYVPQGKTLTIDGIGTLNAIAGGNGDNLYGAAGIGAGYGEHLISDAMPCGNITIVGGIINATGGSSSAGIGAGHYSPCGNITIATTVTRVTARTCDNGLYAAPIGKGNSAGPASVTFGSQPIYNSGDGLSWPDLEHGHNYGGLLLSIDQPDHYSHYDVIWTLTPAN